MTDITMIEDLPPELQQLVRRLRDNFIIAIVKRNGGSMRFPISEIDAASGPLTMVIEGTDFVLKMEPVS